jgi:hypothetical protein
MNADILSNLVDPAILFFFLGLFVGAIRSNLEIPPQVAKFLSLYLLMALGFKGGQALGDAGLDADGLKVIGAAMLLAVLIPAIGFGVLRRKVNPFDAAAISATYGSVSAVTFIAASQFVADQGDEAGGYLTVALVLMESPAIIMAVLLASWVRARQKAGHDLGSFAPASVGDGAGTVETGPEGSVQSQAEGAVARARDILNEGPAPDDSHGPEPLSIKAVLHEAFTDGAHLLLIGSLVIGFASGSEGGDAMAPFVVDIFKGLLAFFLLEMGILVARQLRDVRDVGPFLIGFGVVMPLVAGSIALTLGWILGLGVGDLTMLTVLAASASYIVVPAVVRYAIPEARPSRYFTMALAVTFPFNIVIGIPLYHWIASNIAR